MPRSMTGYGSVQGKLGGRRILIDAKSVNHKFCEVHLRTPPRLSCLEPRIIEYAKSFFKRGRIDIFFREENKNGASTDFQIDVHRLKSYYQELIRTTKTLGISPEINLDTLLNLPSVVTVPEENAEELWEQILGLLKKTFTALEKMRIKEGRSVAIFLEQQLKSFKKEIKAIEGLVKTNVLNYQAQLEDRIQRLTLSAEIDDARLCQEIAYFVDRTDISEELQRLKHHGDHFHDILKSNGPIGRKLDFLLQEMNREANTLSAKSQNALISQHVVECKHLLEKMREQVQNLE